ncbi:MAG TPA: glycine--tRNA ligase, partial [Bacteroidetes bacterium]|nr:glycine--tRNA ligase [Bacteroidota bacterium]
ESYVPYVVETSIGLDRQFLAVLTHAYTEETLKDGSQRMVMKIPPFLAPYKVAVFPLVKKDGLPEKAMEIFDTLKPEFLCFYEEKDSIGKRYRRHDAIGTPYCVTVDHKTLEDNTVTIRERDSMKQDRVPIDEIARIVMERLAVSL